MGSILNIFLNFSLFRGFLCSEEIAEKGGHMVTPPRLEGKDAFTREEEKDTRVITKARSFTEIMNHRVKTFKFLRGPVPEYRLAHISQAYYCCSVFANFTKQLVK